MGAGGMGGGLDLRRGHSCTSRHVRSSLQTDRTYLLLHQSGVEACEVELDDVESGDGRVDDRFELAGLHGGQGPTAHLNGALWSLAEKVKI